MHISFRTSFRLFWPTFGLLAATVSVAATSARGADYITTVENTPGLIGYWRYTTATGANSSVGGYTGTFDGDAALGAAGTGPALADDPANRPVVLDGTNNTYVDTNLVGGINQAGSIVGWFNLATLPSTAGRYFTIAGESQFGNDFDLQIQNDNHLYFYTNGGGAVEDPTAFAAADLNQWIFVAATFTSGGNATLYIDGTQVVQGGAGTHSNGTGTFAMGASDVFGGRFFQGGLDEIAVYNTELSASQVSSIYTSAGTPAGIVPEPSTWAALLLGMAGLVGVMRRRTVSND